MSSQKAIKKLAKGIDFKKLFPRTNVNRSRNFTPYQLKKIKKHLHELARPAGATGVIFPDRPKHYEAAGFVRDGRRVYTSSKTIHIYKVYKHRGKFSFYSANFFGGVGHVQLIPLSFLPQFLEEQIKRDDEYGKWYDKITLREGDRNIHGQSAGFEHMSDTAEEIHLKLIQYKRQGALIGDSTSGGSFVYIQVVFIIFGG